MMQLRLRLSRIPLSAWPGVLLGIIQTLLLLSAYVHVDFYYKMPLSASFVLYYLLFFVSGMIAGMLTLPHKGALKGARAGLTTGCICTVIVTITSSIAVIYAILFVSQGPYGLAPDLLKIVAFAGESFLLFLNFCGILLAVAGGAIGGVVARGYEHTRNGTEDPLDMLDT